MWLLYIFVPVFCFWIGCKWKQGEVDDTNEAKLGLEKVVLNAKTEFRKFKAGTKHDLDRILGSQD